MAQPQPIDQSDPEETSRRGRLVIQTLIILLIPAALSLATIGLVIGLDLPLSMPFGVPGATEAPARGPLLPILLGAIFCSALVILVRLGRPTLSAIVLIGIWTLSITLSTLRFGVTSYFPALLVIPICAAGLLIDRFACLALAALASVLIISGVAIDQSDTSLGVEVIAAGFWVGLYWTVAALTSILAGSLHRALGESRRQAEALRTLSDELEARVTSQTTQILAKEREAATLAERTRLAREIHDTLAQGLIGIVVQIGAARQALVAAPEASVEHLGLAERLAREALGEARRSVWNLRAQALDHGDLGDALRGLAERSYGPAVSFVQTGAPYPLRPEVEAALLRVAQEALANAAHHADTSGAALRLEYAAEAVTLTVTDSGPGFAPEMLASSPPPPAAGSFGLRGMRERLAAIGGTLTMHNRGGAQIVARVPAAQRAAEAARG